MGQGKNTGERVWQSMIMMEQGASKTIKDQRREEEQYNLKRG